MQKLLLGLPLPPFLTATVMLVFVLACYKDGVMRGEVGMTFITVSIAYVACGIACNQQRQ